MPDLVEFWIDPREKVGDLLWPDRFGPAQVAAEKLKGERYFASQHMQAPNPSGGLLFREEHFRFFQQRQTMDGTEFVLLPPRGHGSLPKVVNLNDCQHAGFCDPSSAEKTFLTNPCYTVALDCLITRSRELLVLGMYREQRGSEVLKGDLIRLYRDNAWGYLGIEKDGVGLPLVKSLTAEGLTIKPLGAAGRSKENRAESAAIRMGNGQIYVLEGAGWWPQMQKELLLFPVGKTVDIVDALSHAALACIESSGTIRFDFQGACPIAGP